MTRYEIKTGKFYRWRISSDDAGEIDIYFVPIRPGTYEFYIENMRADGMLGSFVVK